MEKGSLEYYHWLANQPDTEGNMHSCKTNPGDICVKCLYYYDSKGELFNDGKGGQGGSKGIN